MLPPLQCTRLNLPLSWSIGATARSSGPIFLFRKCTRLPSKSTVQVHIQESLFRASRLFQVVVPPTFGRPLRSRSAGALDKIRTSNSGLYLLPATLNLTVLDHREDEPMLSQCLPQAGTPPATISYGKIDQQTFRIHRKEIK